VLEAAAVSGYPKLKKLVVDGCHSVGLKAVRHQFLRALS
jgi:hypothetical protein